MDYDFSIQELKSIVDYVNGASGFGEAAPAVTKLRSLYAALNRKMQEDIAQLSSRSERLQIRVDRMTKRDEQKIAVNGFDELGFDCMEIVQALRWYLLEDTDLHRDMDKYSISTVVYEIYASWLGSKRERVCLQHPQATPYGPRFWRVVNQVPKMPMPTYEDMRLIQSRNPGLAEMIRNSARKYSSFNIKDLVRYHRNNEAYRNASAEKHAGKWNEELDDRDIYLWRSTVKSPEKPKQQ